MVTGTTNLVQPNQIANSSVTSATNPIEMASATATTTTKRISDTRRSNKPIMEKRRRARINNSLNELKTLILDAMKKDPARHSKLEKADILEMTVKHLQNLQRQQAAMSAAADPSVLSKFRAGFSECATEVGRYPGLDPIVKRRLLQHLANCLNQNPTTSSPSSPSSSSTINQQSTAIKGQLIQEVQQVQVHIVPNPELSAQNNGIILSNGNGTGVQLVPTRLPNGDIALVLPTTTATTTSVTASPAIQHHLQAPPPQIINSVASSPASPLPLLVPIPQRASSASSAASSSSVSSLNYSPSHSPEPESLYYQQPQQHYNQSQMHHQQIQPKPLSLVVRKCEEPVEEKPWRPW